MAVLVRWAPLEGTHNAVGAAMRRELSHRFRIEPTHAHLQTWIARHIRHDPEVWRTMLQTRAASPKGAITRFEVFPPRWLHAVPTCELIFTLPNGDRHGGRLGFMQTLRGTTSVDQPFAQGVFGQEWWFDARLPTDVPTLSVGVEVRVKSKWPHRANGADDIDRAVWTDYLTPEIKLVDGSESVMTPVRAPAMETWIDEKSCFYLMLIDRPPDKSPTVPHRITLSINQFMGTKRREGWSDGLTLALIFEVIRDGVVVIRGELLESVLHRWRYPSDSYLSFQPEFVNDYALAPGVTASDWRLRIRSNPERALLDIHSERYLDIDVEAPLCRVYLTRMGYGSDNRRSQNQLFKNVAREERVKANSTVAEKLSQNGLDCR